MKLIPGLVTAITPTATTVATTAAMTTSSGKCKHREIHYQFPWKIIIVSFLDNTKNEYCKYNT